jgi:hypothetical protein
VQQQCCAGKRCGMLCGRCGYQHRKHTSLHLTAHMLRMLWQLAQADTMLFRLVQSSMCIELRSKCTLAATFAGCPATRCVPCRP